MNINDKKIVDSIGNRIDELTRLLSEIVKVLDPIYDEIEKLSES